MENNLFWYEYKLRGFSLGCQPVGFIKHNEDIGKYGIVAYDRQLTNKELFGYDLIPYKEEISLSNMIYYFNTYHSLNDKKQYYEAYEAIEEYAGSKLDYDLLECIQDNNYSYWIKVINNESYYYSDCVLKETLTSHIQLRDDIKQAV